MIVNRPNPIAFEKQSIQYLVQALDLIYEKERNELQILDEDEIPDYWDYHQGILNNSLVLLFLSLENHLKTKLCEISPLLLIADEPKKWGSLHQDKNYQELFLHSFDDLLILYVEMKLGSLDPQVTSNLSDLRDKRNKITHGFLSEKITLQYILDTFYIIAKHIFGARVWWDKLKSYLFNEPLFGSFDENIEKASLTFYVDFFMKYLQTKNSAFAA